MLDAASVCGSQFAATEVAAMLPCPEEEVEAHPRTNSPGMAPALRRRGS